MLTDAQDHKSVLHQVDNRLLTTLGHAMAIINHPGKMPVDLKLYKASTTGSHEEIEEATDEVDRKVTTRVFDVKLAQDTCPQQAQARRPTTLRRKRGGGKSKKKS